MHDDLTHDTPPAGGAPFKILGLHWMAWIFILFAIADLVWFILNANIAAGSAISDVLVYGLQVFPAIAAILFPTLLLWRHPDASTRAPILLLGTILFALVQLLLILANPLGPIFEGVTPTSEDVPFVALAEIYNGLTLAIAAIGLGLIARGLSLARRYVDLPAPIVDWFVPVATMFAIVVGILAASRLSLGEGPVAWTTIVYIGANVILGVVRIAAWAYLMTSAFRGVLAGEDPRPGWRLATFAGAVILFALALVNLAGLVDITDATVGLVYGWVVVGAYSLGHLSLLLAFARGLPALDEAQADDFDEGDDVEDADDFDEDNDDGFEAEEGGYEGGPVYDDEFPEERRR